MELELDFFKEPTPHPAQKKGHMGLRDHYGSMICNANFYSMTTKFYSKYDIL